MKNYTFNDFSEGFEPYEDLYALRGEPFAHERAREQLSRLAKSVGYPCFKRTYQKYRQSLEFSTEDSGSEINVTEFTGQPLQLRSGRWVCNDDGIYTVESGVSICACHHPLMPTAVLMNVETKAEKLKISFCKRQKWRSYIVPRQTVYNSREIIRMADLGVDVTSESAKNLVRYIRDVVEQLNPDSIPVIQSVGRLGFIDGYGFSPYDSGLQFDGDKALLPIYRAIGSRGDTDAWLRTARECRKGSITARIVLAASFASVLINKLGGLPFFVHLWGIESGTGKTVALMLAASVWGDPALGRYIQTFNATQVSQERIAGFLNHLPLLIDELQLLNDSFDVYQLAEGVGRGRGNKNGGIDETLRWANCIITSGEAPITKLNSGAGAMNRVIDIECAVGDMVIADGPSVSANIRNNYGFAGKEFVSFLGSTGADDKLRSYYQQYLKALSARDVSEKQTLSAAILLTADRLVTEILFKDGTALTAEDMIGFLKTKTNVSLGERGYKSIREWVSVNSNHFETDNRYAEIYGEIVGDYAYIIRSEFNRACQEMGIDGRALLSWLRSRELIQTRGRHFTVPRRIGSRPPVECVALKLPV